MRSASASAFVVRREAVADSWLPLAGGLRNILNFLPQGVRAFDVFKRTDEDLMGFLKLLPLLRYLKHSSMKERHWDMVKEVLRVRALQVDSPTFRLKDALRLDLATNEAELNEVVVRAQKEEVMEATLISIAGQQFHPFALLLALFPAISSSQA